MKKRFKITLGVMIIFFSFTACQGSKTTDLNLPENSSVSKSSSVNEDKLHVESEYIQHDNLRVNYTKDEVVKIINDNSEFKIAEIFFADVPKSIDHVSTFYSGTVPPIPGKESIEEFKEVFRYLFPDHVFDESCFFYIGPNSTGEDGYNTVKEKYDELISGEEEFYLFVYNELRTDKEDKVALTLRIPFGGDITTINKNVAQKIAYQNGLAEGYGGDIFNAGYYFTYVGSYSPDSEEVFKLLDKEISIKEAVNVFKDFIKNLPCSVETYYSINVNDVQVYKVNDDLYCYNYTTSRLYDNIPFDYAVSGSRGGRGNRDLGIGSMIKSNDVDFVYSTFKTETVIEEKQFTKIMPFEEAVKIVADEMTDYVDFEVKSAQLVYCSDNDIDETGKLGNTRWPVFPAWKIVLYNPNDEYNYSCYVNVLDGKFESYSES